MTSPSSRRSRPGWCCAAPRSRACGPSQVQMADAYARFGKHDAWLEGVHIAPYAFATGSDSPDPGPPPQAAPARRAEIEKIGARVAQERLAVVPLAIYFKDGPGQGRAGPGPGPPQGRPPPGHGRARRQPGGGRRARPPAQGHAWTDGRRRHHRDAGASRPVPRNRPRNRGIHSGWRRRRSGSTGRATSTGLTGFDISFAGRACDPSCSDSLNGAPTTTANSSSLSPPDLQVSRQHIVSRKAARGRSTAARQQKRRMTA